MKLVLINLPTLDLPVFIVLILSPHLGFSSSPLIVVTTSLKFSQWGACTYSNHEIFWFLFKHTQYLGKTII